MFDKKRPTGGDEGGAGVNADDGQWSSDQKKNDEKGPEGEEGRQRLVGKEGDYPLIAGCVFPFFLFFSLFPSFPLVPFPHAPTSPPWTNGDAHPAYCQIGYSPLVHCTCSSDPLLLSVCLCIGIE